ncbi:MAG: DUF3108 domain-containing protein [Armatimonadetes bacterium]|nr:DUF3108 domain-containing protein [Armatimonadota bacterium]
MRFILIGWLLLCAVSAPAEDRYYRIEIAGKHIGYAHDMLQKTPQGVQVTFHTAIKVSLLGSPADVQYQAVADYPEKGGNPRRFSATVEEMGQTATVDCRFEKNRVNARASTSGSETRKRITLPPGTVLLEGNLLGTWDKLLAEVGSFKGRKTATVFAPTALAILPVAFRSTGRASMRIQGKSLACDVLEAAIGPQKVSLWVDRGSRRLVRLEDPAQKARVTLDDKSAVATVERAEVLSRVFAISDVVLPSPQTLERLKAKVRVNVVAERITPASLRRPYQQFTGRVRGNTANGTFAIRRYRYAPRTPSSLARMPGAARRAGLSRYLKPEARIESDDPEIKTLARQLAKETDDAWQAASKLADWVFRNVRYKITGASARQALRSREGDCGPHTFLTIALCRAAGIPARMVGGAMYSPTILGGSFGQHYWVEVWIGRDGWVPLDPTTGEIGTLSPAHLTFWRQGSIGSLSIRVLDYAPKSSPKPVALAVRPLKLAVGLTERYKFFIDGKEIGEQTARVEKETADPSGPTYEISHAARLKVSESLTVTTSGALRLLASGRPLHFSLDADVGGQKQSIICRFDGAKVKADIKTGEMGAARTLDVPEGSFLIANNLITAFSLITRTLPWDTRSEFKVPVWAATTLQPLNITLKTVRKEQLQGKTVYVVDARPIGETFYVAVEDGRILKLVDARQKLEVRAEE